MIDPRIKKYSTAAPRYTSYPTLPYWDTNNWNPDLWINAVKRTADSAKQGISLYIHLPFCESLCTYCGCNTRITKNHDVELPYIAAVLKEWRMYLEQIGKQIYINDLHLGGGTPTFFKPKNLAFLIEEILRDAKPVQDAAFSFEAHPANTTEEHLEVLYKLGFRRLSLGIQDFKPEVQHIINRKQSPADVIRVMQDARRLGYVSINFDLIYGLPRQTMAGIIDTIQIALNMKPDRIAFYSYAHVPWMKPGQRLFTAADLPNDEDKLNFYYTGKEMIKAAGYLDIGMDHFAFVTDSLAISSKNGLLHRNFMGYTDKQSSLLLGLGVSSISDAQTAYSQNVKSVEEYKTLLNNNKFPLLKGHVLTEEDLLIRKQILDIMCNGELLLNGKTLPSEVQRRLSHFIADGMVTLDHQRLKVTVIGKSFLRNICMAFDERLLADKKQKQVFSNAI